MMVENMITYAYILKPILNCVFFLIIVTVSLVPGMLAHSITASPFLIDGREGGAVQFGPDDGEKVTAFEHMIFTRGMGPRGSVEFISMDWFKGKSTGNHGFYHQI